MMKSGDTKSLKPVYLRVQKAEMFCLQFSVTQAFLRPQSRIFEIFSIFRIAGFNHIQFELKHKLNKSGKKYVFKFDYAFFLIGSCVSYTVILRKCERKCIFLSILSSTLTQYVRNSYNFKPWKIPDLRLKQNGINEKMTLKILHFHACQSSAK